MLEKTEFLGDSVGYFRQRKVFFRKRPHLCSQDVKILVAIQFSFNPVHNSWAVVRHAPPYIQGFSCWPQVPSEIGGIVPGSVHTSNVLRRTPRREEGFFIRPDYFAQKIKIAVNVFPFKHDLISAMNFRQKILDTCALTRGTPSNKPLLVSAASWFVLPNRADSLWLVS